MQNLSPSAMAAETGGTVGFFGKIPSRGDFVRAGLPGSFVAGWDAWLQAMLPASKHALGDGWLAAWLEAPIWHFLLQPGACGPDAAIGVLMPSVDRAGRHFPLTLACVAPNAAPFAQRKGWLAVAERAGIAALETDLEPDAIAQLLLAPPPPTAALPDVLPQGRCAWWTDGAPLVPATAFATDALPGADVFALMLDAKMTVRDGILGS